MEKYPELKNLVKIAKVLDGLKIPYYITGGFAVSIYGRPRFTADIDMVIKMSHPTVRDFTTKLQEIFPKGYVDENQINDALAWRGEFNIIDPESGLKVDFFITKDDEFEKECFKKARPQDIGYKVNFTNPENLIISKLIWYRNSESTRQLEDIASVVDIQKKLDQQYLTLWISKLGLEQEWRKSRKLNK
ncbi:MAG: nucleotidyltransferase [Patescibacteria group bacterium]|nr:nucleotidyltransferase [Patescibacteria group bacterium]